MSHENKAFIIPLDAVVEVQKETRESLTAARLALFGVFAFAAKKETEYLRVSFKNDIGEISNMLFELAFPDKGHFTQLIMQKRYELIKNMRNAESVPVQ